MEEKKSMYNITPEMIEKLRALLEAKGIPASEDDNQLALLISQATTLIGDEYIHPRSEVDYDYDFKGDLYITAEYPILTEEVEVYLDDKNITSSILSITCEGVIHFKQDYEGILKTNYTVGLSDEKIEDYLLLATMYLCADDNNMGNVSSITEGDVSIGYDRTGNTGNSLDSIISEVHKQFGARVKLI